VSTEPGRDVPVAAIVVSVAVPVIAAALILPPGAWRGAWLYGSMLVLAAVAVVLASGWHR
jgi:hypothetical protein